MKNDPLKSLNPEEKQKLQNIMHDIDTLKLYDLYLHQAHPTIQALFELTATTENPTLKDFGRYLKLLQENRIVHEMELFAGYYGDPSNFAK